MYITDWNRILSVIILSNFQISTYKKTLAHIYIPSLVMTNIPSTPLCDRILANASSISALLLDVLVVLVSWGDGAVDVDIDGMFEIKIMLDWLLFVVCCFVVVCSNDEMIWNLEKNDGSVTTVKLGVTVLFRVIKSWSFALQIQSHIL